MNTSTLTRRTVILAAASLPLAGALAQVADLNDAINKAGSLRMLSERLGKAWLALAQGIESNSAQQVLDKSTALFDRQLLELKTYAAAPDVRDTYTKLDAAWGSYKTALTGAAPAKGGAATLLQYESKVLALAHQGTAQFESATEKPLGKLVNIAGRQRMLSQRMAMYYLAAKLPVDAATAVGEIDKARAEFVRAMPVLRDAPQTTTRIKDELQQAEMQWVLFDAALQKVNVPSNYPTKHMSDVFVASEKMLAMMDRVTSLYSAIKT